MDLPHMRTLYDVGRLSDVVAIADNHDNSWHLDCHDLWGHTLHLTNKHGTMCQFKNLDKATLAAKSIGFEDIQVLEH